MVEVFFTGQSFCGSLNNSVYVICKLELQGSILWWRRKCYWLVDKTFLKGFDVLLGPSLLEKVQHDLHIATFS